MREFAGQVIPRVKALIDEWRPEPGGIVNRAVAD
ncbi:hypothetical protein BX592_12273 [Paraburkholderia rhizosphaerae]|uniref:Uncharacterized protein n=1 Tax=Paraburkholderia rhizosphaerae TaxID=480658 RepID=A0A4V3HDT7_9BURK|nr:hypothetical protein BX592_12273 [Paraburkholderia rhizosphaerae]